MGLVGDEVVKIKVESSSFYFDLYFDPKSKSWEASGYFKPYRNSNCEGPDFSGRATSMKGAEAQLMRAIHSYLCYLSKNQR